MKHIRKFTRKYSFLIILILTGSFYLTLAESREVYAGPVEQIKSWYAQWENMLRGSGTVSGNGVSGNSQVGQSVSENNESVSGSLPPAESAPSENFPAAGTDTGGNGIPDGSGAVGTQPEVQEPVTWRSPEEVEYTVVDDTYFSDAVFIGDSRTVGMFEYGGLEEISTFYASTGLTVYKLFDSPIVSVPGQKEKQTIDQALTEKQFSKIYLMIGINEMGTGTVETFIEKYREAVEHLKELQPGAIIYLQGIMRVTTERSNQGDYITNQGIDARNAEIEKLANNVDVYYLDVNPLICDETGGMIPEYTFDGVHLKAQYMPIWKDYLKSKAVLLD